MNASCNNSFAHCEDTTGSMIVPCCLRVVVGGGIHNVPISRARHVAAGVNIAGVGSSGPRSSHFLVVGSDCRVFGASTSF